MPAVTLVSTIACPACGRREAETMPTGACRYIGHGFEETESGIASKMARGTFSATFLMACLAVLEKDGLKLEEI